MELTTHTVVLSEKQWDAITEAVEYSLEMEESFGYTEDEPEYRDRMDTLNSILEVA